MPERLVTLDYSKVGGADAFVATPESVPVQPGETIRFKLGSHPTGSKFRITLERDQHFSRKHLPGPGPTESSAEEQTVAMKKIPAPAFAALKADFQVTSEPITRYKCELLSATGGLLATSGAGGEIEPDLGSGT
jgi:hypothetical protein